MTSSEAARGAPPGPDPGTEGHLATGELVGGRFRVETVAGVGGMGAVYRAQDEHSGRPVALKILTLDGGEYAERFTREAQVLARLKHPAIVRYIAHGKAQDGRLYLAMEWLDGDTLSRRIFGSRLPVRRTLGFARRVSDALAAAHAQGIVHRDIKPGNLFLQGGELERVRLLDFGLVRINDMVKPLTRSGALLGTPGYMAPEQARGTRTLDARADVFSLGCVLFECLTGRAAFMGHNLMAILAKILLEDAPRVREVRAEVPEALDELIARMLSKDPGDRPESAAEVAQALSAIGDVEEVEDAEVEGDPSRAALTSGEQRLLSIVVAGNIMGDLRTAATMPLAPEDSAEQRERREKVEGAVKPFGANVEWLADGSMVATLGGHDNAADQAAHAARCALALREHLGSEMPMALATGRGVMAERWPVGEAIDRASRILGDAMQSLHWGSLRGEQLQDIHTANLGKFGILLDELTAGLLGQRFEVAGSVVGLELGNQKDDAQVSRTLLGKPTPFVGRKRELRTLEATYDECVDEEVCQAILITAPGGTGKSRLRHEFAQRVSEHDDAPQIWVARGDPMTAGTPFGLIAQLVRNASGITDEEPLEARQQRLRGLAARRILNTEDAERVARFLGELCGVPFPDEEDVQLRAARLDPALRGDQMRRAFEDWVTGECQAKPVVLILEDLQWGDLPTVNCIDGVLRNLEDAPLMLCVFARPEVHELFPKLWENRGLTEIQLTPLSRKACEKLIVGVLGDAPQEVAELLIQRAQGNAFYLEELIRAHAQGNANTLPPTVLAMVAARLEQLEPDMRRVLRAASVFGQRFDKAGVSRLLGRVSGPNRESNLVDDDGLGTWLEALAEAECLSRLTPESSEGATLVPQDEQWGFRHAMVQEAAYGMLTEEDRVLGHRLAGDYLEELGVQTAPLAIAEHFERGERPVRAVHWYRRAAAQDLEGNDLDSAQTRAQRGIDCGAEGEELGLLLQLMAEIHKWRGDNKVSRDKAAQALGLLTAGSAAWYAAAGEAAAASGKLGEHDALEAMADRLLGQEPADAAAATAGARTMALARNATQLYFGGKGALADRLLGGVIGELEGDAARSEEDEGPDAAVAAWVFEARAIRANQMKDAAGRVRLAQEAAQCFETAGDLRNACLQRVSVGFALNEVGAYQEAEEALRNALTTARRMNITNAANIARAQLGRALFHRDALLEARAVANDAVLALEKQGNTRLEGVARGYLARILIRLDEHQPALREAGLGVARLEGVPPMLPSAQATLALVRMAAGDIDGALEMADAAWQPVAEGRSLATGESLVRMARAEVLLAAGREEEAKAAFADARDALESKADGFADAALATSLKESVPENVQVLKRCAELGV